MINLFQTEGNQTKLTPNKLNQEIKLSLSFEHQADDVRANITILDQLDKELFEQYLKKYPEKNPFEEESDYYKVWNRLHFSV
jgi:hypothetical protein